MCYVVYYHWNWPVDSTQNVVFLDILKTSFRKPPSSTRCGTGSEQHPRSQKSGCPAERHAVISWVSRTHHFFKNIQFIDRRSTGQHHSIVPEKRSDNDCQKQALPANCLRTPPNFPRFLGDLYQNQLWGFPLCPNLECNRCPTLQPTEKQFSELTETRV